MLCMHAVSVRLCLPVSVTHRCSIETAGRVELVFGIEAFFRPVLKNSENRIIVSEVMAKSLVSCFLTHGVDLLCF